jgi:hypothetical protein
MLTTGLLSLNIHDFSTFEGTELSLHPDLFSSADAATSGSQQNRSTSQQHGGKSNEDSNTAKGGGASTVSGTTTSNAASLAVGDMIEIRVWDPRETSPLKSPSSNTVRSKVSLRAAPIPQPPSSTNSVASTSASTHIDLQPSVSSYSKKTVNSLQYSEASEQQNEDALVADGNDISTLASSKDRSPADVEAASSGDDAQQAPPTKTVVTVVGSNNNNSNNPTQSAPSMLPPIFPRRGTGSDGPLLSTKPVPIHRRIPSTAGIQKPHKLGLHRRDISDMTADSHHMDIVDIHPTESADTHDDGTWSKVGASHKLRLSFVCLVTDKTLVRHDMLGFVS